MAPTSSDATPLRLHCTVEGNKLLVPPTPAPAVCTHFALALAEALHARVTVIAERPATPGGWIGVALRFRQPGIASAALTDARGARSSVHPTQSIARSDRPLDASVLNLLAQRVATALMTTHKTD